MDDRSAKRRRVLVAEDQALISLMVEEELREAGLDVIGPFPSCAEASEWLRHDTPDAAVLDVELSDGPCSDVAEELTRRGVEFAVFSGDWESEAPAAFAHARWFAKPSDLKLLIAMLLEDGRSAPGQPQDA